MKKYLNLFFTMLKIGLFTFGGGYAMIALLENELITKKKWMKREEFLDMVAIAESTPGPVAINASTYIGFKVSGVWGALLSTIAVCIPSFTIIYGISLIFDTFLSYTLVQYAFRGIQVGVIYLIFTAGWNMLKSMEKTPFTMCIFIGVIVALLGITWCSINFSTIAIIVICGGLGVMEYLLLKRNKMEE